MPRSYRGIILALGLILACSNHAYAEGSGKQPDAQQSVADSLRNISSRYDEQAERVKRADKEDGPCGERQYGSSADLCAQWKAADAASDSAWWAWAAGIAGIVSTLGVVAALAIGWHSNWIVRDSAKRQLRAYLSIEPAGINAANGGLHRVPINLVNSGQTPANNLTHAGDFLIIEGDPRQFNPAVSGRITEETEVADSDNSLGAGANRYTYASLEAELCKTFLDKIHRREAAIVHYGYVAYRDVFGSEHRTSFAFYHWGEELSDLESKRCRYGNDAT